MRLPSFLGIGTQKGGTTTLHTLLQKHPDVHLPAEKEVHFFTLHFNKGARWYEEWFARSNGKQCCGEITPYYLFHPEAPLRIQRLLPNARLIVLLRDPVERCLSGLFHSKRLGVETLTPEAALEAEADRLAGAENVLAGPGGRHHSHQYHSYLSRSRYEQQLERYQAQFPCEQLLLLRSEDFFGSPVKVWRQILQFLELSDHPLPEEYGIMNAGSWDTESVESDLKQRLRQQLSETYAIMEKRYGLQW